MIGSYLLNQNMIKTSINAIVGDRNKFRKLQFTSYSRALNSHQNNSHEPNLKHSWKQEKYPHRAYFC